MPLDLNVRSLSQEIGISRSDWYNMSPTYGALLNPIQTGTGIIIVNPYTGAGGQGHVTSLTPITRH